MSGFCRHLGLTNSYLLYIWWPYGKLQLGLYPGEGWGCYSAWFWGGGVLPPCWKIDPTGSWEFSKQVSNGILKGEKGYPMGSRNGTFRSNWSVRSVPMLKKGVMVLAPLKKHPNRIMGPKIWGQQDLKNLRKIPKRAEPSYLPEPMECPPPRVYTEI